MRCLLLGRFQPLHLGHIGMIEYAASRSKYLVIGIGSCNRWGVQDNPFSAQEREQMIKESLDLKVPYELKRIPDFDDRVKWISWIRDNISFDAFASNSSAEKNIFEESGFQVIDVPFYDRQKYSSTQIRDRIISGGDWQSLLPAGAVRVMSEINGAERIRGLAGN
jgi:nicotinamide-nucleotide adenylyltransferase